MGNEVETRLMEIITGDMKDHESRIAVLEKNDVKQDERIAVQQKTLDKIDANVSWVLRLIIGAIVLAVLGVALVKTPIAKAASIETVGGAVYGTR